VGFHVSFNIGRVVGVGTSGSRLRVLLGPAGRRAATWQRPPRAARPHDSDRRDGGHQGLLHEAAAAHTASAAARAYCTPINGRGQCCDRACSSLLLACAERSL